MTFALVQSTEGSRLTGGQRTISATYGQAVTAGNLLVCVVSRETASLGVATCGQVSDGTNKWRQVTESTTSASTQGIDIWICEHPAAGTPTVTALLADWQPHAITGLNIWIAEYSGGSGFELLDQQGIARGTTTSLTVTTAYNLTGNHDLALSVVTGNMSAATVPSGYASRLVDATQQFWIADNVDTGTSAGSTSSAAWTGLTGATVTMGIVVTFKQVGVAASAPHLVQTSFSEPVPPANFTNPATQTSQAYPVNPAVGNTLVAFITGASYVGNTHIQSGTTITLTDTAGNTWVKMADQGADNSQGLNWSVWVCPSAKGGATTLTVTYAPVGIQTPCWLLLEFANLPPLSTDSVGSYLATSNLTTVSTSGSVHAGSIGCASVGMFPTGVFTPGSGWISVGSDTTGGNFLQMILSVPSTGVLTVITSAGSSLASAMVCGLRLSPGAGAH
jgi:hypothetical protein